MSSKAPFFAKKADVTGADFAQAWRSMVLNAYSKRFDDVAEASFYLALQGIDFETTLSFSIMMQKLGILEGVSLRDSIFTPASCGDTANGFCMLMAGKNMAAKHDEISKSIEYLQNDMEAIFPFLVRMDVTGHAYVLLCTEKIEGDFFGYIYQSNVGEGMEDNSYSIAAWLKSDKARKTNLSQHIANLSELMDPETSDDRRKQLYDELYCVMPIVEIKIPADMDKLIEPWKKNPRASYQIEKANFKAMLNILNLKYSEKDLDPNKGVSLDEYISQKLQEEKTSPMRLP